MHVILNTAFSLCTCNISSEYIGSFNLGLYILIFQSRLVHFDLLHFDLLHFDLR